MLKKILLICLLCFSVQAIQAQSNAAEAKAAYLLAEESYGKGDYKSALEFLQQAREALGGNNCKVLYLQIMATRELYAKDTSLNSKLLPLIFAFEKSADYADFNEEKSLEITKLKLLVKKEMRTAQEQADAGNKQRDTENRRRAETEKQVSDLVNKWGRFGISLDEADAAHPDWGIKTWEKFELLGSVIYHPRSVAYSRSSYPFTKTNNDDTSLAGKISGIVFTDGMLRGYYSYVMDHEGADHGDIPPEMKKASDEVTEKTGIVPAGNKYYSKRISGPHAPAYEWTYKGLSGTYVIYDFQVSFPAKKGNRVAKLLRYVGYYPSNNNR